MFLLEVEILLLEKQKPTATVTSAGATVEGGEEQEVSADVHATQGEPL